MVPFSPFYFGFSLLKPNIKEKGTLIIKVLLGNLGRALGFRDFVVQGSRGLGV